MDDAYWRRMDLSCDFSFSDSSSVSSDMGRDHPVYIVDDTPMSPCHNGDSNGRVLSSSDTDQSDIVLNSVPTSLQTPTPDIKGHSQSREIYTPPPFPQLETPTQPEEVLAEANPQPGDTQPPEHTCHISVSCIKEVEALRKEIQSLEWSESWSVTDKNTTDTPPENSQPGRLQPLIKRLRTLLENIPSERILSECHEDLHVNIVFFLELIYMRLIQSFIIVGD
jgi:hypothetical protein